MHRWRNAQVENARQVEKRWSGGEMLIRWRNAHQVENARQVEKRSSGGEMLIRWRNAHQVEKWYVKIIFFE